MPLYEYRCRSCAKPFEALVGVRSNGEATVRCPSCDTDDVERLLGLPALGKVIEGPVPATNCRGDGPPCGAPRCGRKV